MHSDRGVEPSYFTALHRADSRKSSPEITCFFSYIQSSVYAGCCSMHMKTYPTMIDIRRIGVCVALLPPLDYSTNADNWFPAWIANIAIHSILGVAADANSARCCAHQSSIISLQRPYLISESRSNTQPGSFSSFTMPMLIRPCAVSALSARDSTRIRTVTSGWIILTLCYIGVRSSTYTIRLS